jgi:hypothetical protein
LDRFKKPKNFPILFVIINDFDNLQISGYGQEVWKILTHPKVKIYLGSRYLPDFQVL